MDDDAAMLADLRSMWERFDEPPTDLTARMIAAVAVEDVSREYALLTQVPTELSAVRNEHERLTLQFHDEATNVVLHVSESESGMRRVDGWAEPEVLAARLSQGDREWAAEMGGEGRFAFADVEPGLSTVRLVVRVDG
ncbi:hypothetical protein, partial [Microbacterium sp.]|uniref:hypothetical protein n=1 Tax=Microbacterium sp. TaxID=51671 RepID=UPI00281230CD